MQEEQKETAAGSPVASFQTRRDKPIEVMSLQGEIHRTAAPDPED